MRKEEDYAAFERVIEQVRERLPTRLLSYCLMPNHWHLVLWPVAGEAWVQETAKQLFAFSEGEEMIQPVRAAVFAVLASAVLVSATTPATREVILGERVLGRLIHEESVAEQYLPAVSLPIADVRLGAAPATMHTRHLVFRGSRYQLTLPAIEELSLLFRGEADAGWMELVVRSDDKARQLTLRRPAADERRPPIVPADSLLLRYCLPNSHDCFDLLPARVSELRLEGANQGETIQWRLVTGGTRSLGRPDDALVLPAAPWRSLLTLGGTAAKAMMAEGVEAAQAMGATEWSDAVSDEQLLLAVMTADRGHLRQTADSREVKKLATVACMRSEIAVRGAATRYVSSHSRLYAFAVGEGESAYVCEYDQNGRLLASLEAQQERGKIDLTSLLKEYMALHVTVRAPTPTPALGKMP